MIWALIARYVVPALAAIGLGAWSGWHFGSQSWQTKYEALQAQDWQVKAQTQQARAEALQAQIRGFKSLVQTNSEVMNALQKQRDDAVGDATRFAHDARRMLDDVAQAGSGRCAVSQTPDQPRAPATDAAPGIGQAAQLLGDAIAECRANLRQGTALIEEISPQL